MLKWCRTLDRLAGLTPVSIQHNLSAGLSCLRRWRRSGRLLERVIHALTALRRLPKRISWFSFLVQFIGCRLSFSIENSYWISRVSMNPKKSLIDWRFDRRSFRERLNFSSTERLFRAGERSLSRFIDDNRTASTNFTLIGIPRIIRTQRIHSAAGARRKQRHQLGDRIRNQIDSQIGPSGPALPRDAERYADHSDRNLFICQW